MLEIDLLTSWMTCQSAIKVAQTCQSSVRQGTQGMLNGCDLSYGRNSCVGDRTEGWISFYFLLVFVDVWLTIGLYLLMFSLAELHLAFEPLDFHSFMFLLKCVKWVKTWKPSSFSGKSWLSLSESSWGLNLPLGTSSWSRKITPHCPSLWHPVMHLWSGSLAFRSCLRRRAQMDQVSGRIRSVAHVRLEPDMEKWHEMTWILVK